ncbi:MAG: response regulator [Verrucomicrobiae bacterium]|nr:response regulator [Verrucomicrobiae bacterium]
MNAILPRALLALPMWLHATSGRAAAATAAPETAAAEPPPALPSLSQALDFGVDPLAFTAVLLALGIALLMIRGNAALRRRLTQHTRQIASLTKQSEEYATLFDAVPALVLFKDDQNRHLRINRAGAELLGRAREAIEGHHASEIDPIRAQQFHRDDIEVIRSGRPKLGIIESFPVAGGGERWVRTDKIPYRDPSGRVIGVIVFAVDITERLEAQLALQCAHDELEARVEERTAALKAEVLHRRRAEEEARRARTEAESADHAKSQFLAAMSHEIRTPMNAIIGMSNLLLETPLNTEQKEFAQTVRVSGEALLTIINDILDFSKIEAGKLDFEERDFDLPEVVEGVLDVLAETAQSKGLELAGLVESDVPARLRGDPGRLRQILLNLVANAVKFTPSGEVILTVGCVELNDLAARLRISVRDTGIGIPPEAQTRLFQPFVQADAATSRHVGGTGLGLAISRRLVEMMDGTIEVESAPGRGSTFTFTVLLRAAQSPAPQVAPTLRPVAGRRALIVDDNAASGAILDYLATSWGLRTGGWAASADEARRHLEEALQARDPFDIALIDLHLPGPDGLELARSLHADPRFNGLPILLLAPRSHRIAPDTLRQAGVHARVGKPVRASQLHCAVANALAPQSIPRSAHPASPVHGLPAPPSCDPQPPNRAALRILVAEDNLVNQKVTVRQLACLGYSADTVANGSEALEAIQSVAYNVILMDCLMPELDGYETTRRLRRLGHDSARLCIIAMTANAMQGDREQCLAAGMDDYVAKPTRLEHLEEALDRAKARLFPGRSALAIA